MRPEVTEVIPLNVQRCPAHAARDMPPRRSAHPTKVQKAKGLKRPARDHEGDHRPTEALPLDTCILNRDAGPRVTKDPSIRRPY